MQLIEIRNCISHFGPRFSPSGIVKSAKNESICDCARSNKHNQDDVVCGNIFIQENLQNNFRSSKHPKMDPSNNHRQVVKLMGISFLNL